MAEEKVDGYFKTLTGYSPVFRSFEGSVYEMELTRSAIESFARHCSKLKPEIKGSAYKKLENRMQFSPAPFLDTTKFISKIATTLSVNNNAFIVPIMSEDDLSITGFYPVIPERSEIKEYQGVPYFVYTFSYGQKAAIELERVGIMNQFFYKDDFFGESNLAFNPTMQLLYTQNQAIIEGVKQSATIRFIAKLANTYKRETIEEEKKRFTEDNLAADNNSGVLMFDNKYADVKQIISKPFIVDSDQMKVIRENVFYYFGTNEKILCNNYTEDEWNAYYEGKIEPFSIQLSLVMSNMAFTRMELAKGNMIVFSSNRLQYASSSTKLNVSTQLFDRGMLSRNEIRRDIWNMSETKDGDKYYIRKEYAEVDKLNESQGLTEGSIKNDNQGQNV